jgi:molybdopterin molybdotransferase
MVDLTPLDEVRRLVLARRAPLAASRLPIRDALGCVLAEVVVATESVPPFANSAMDGYALRADDTSNTPACLRVVGSTMAGDYPAMLVGPGEAVRIMTGAPVPVGVDAVCAIELTQTGEDGTVLINRSVAPGENIRKAGEDVATGSVVFEPGAVLTPAHLGVLASIGVQDVLVHPHPRVGVISTGNELVDGPVALRPGQLRESNRTALLALVASEGWRAVDLGTIADDEAAMTAAITNGLSQCDALLTTGGVGMGDRDVVKNVIEELAGPSGFVPFQVAVKPGKPFAFGEVGPAFVPIFGLPGNPVAAMVGYEIYARPALRRLAGHDVLDRPILEAIADHPFRRKVDGKTHFMRVAAALDPSGHVHVRTAGRQESHMLSTMAGANALAILPDGPGIDAGCEVRIMLLSSEGLARRDSNGGGTSGG